MLFLITAGPTREPIDPVRFISNRSSGKMGYAIAEAAIEAGHEVVLVSGPVCIAPPAGARVINVTTSDEMFEAVHSNLEGVEIAVLCAAVADFKPANYSPEKIKKERGLENIPLIPARDILASLGKLKKNFFLAGFAAETEMLAQNAQKKLREKNCDVIVGNDVSGMNTGMESDHNEVVLYFKDGEILALPREKKSGIAKKIVNIFVSRAK